MLAATRRDSSCRAANRRLSMNTRCHRCTWVERAKNAIRCAEAAISPWQRSLTLDGRKLSLVRSVWWDDTGNDRVRDEIESYWEAVPANRDFRLILDVGASVGLFTLSACVRTQADIVAFEPARRQRILWRRNIQRNGFAGRARLEPVGLWDAAGQLPFRTH